jgi:hypothetical protein
MRYVMILFMLSFLILACVDNSTEPEDVLVLSDSFEISGIGSLAGWHYNPYHAALSDDAPEDGGSWSLALTPGTSAPGNAIKYLEPGNGDGIYRLTVWVKRIGTDGNFASVRFGIMAADSSLDVAEQIMVTTLDTWVQAVETDTLAFVDGDRIYIELSAGLFDPQNDNTWQSRFDLVRLEKLAE